MTEAPVVTFVDELPPITRPEIPKRESKYKPVAQALRDNPGKWAIIVQNVSASAASQFKRTGYGAFTPVEEFEFSSRKTGGKHTVFGRYIGDTDVEPHADLAPEVAEDVPDDVDE